MYTGIFTHICLFLCQCIYTYIHTIDVYTLFAGEKASRKDGV